MDVQNVLSDTQALGFDLFYYNTFDLYMGFCSYQQIVLIRSGGGKT